MEATKSIRHIFADESNVVEWLRNCEDPYNFRIVRMDEKTGKNLEIRETVLIWTLK